MANARKLDFPVEVALGEFGGDFGGWIGDSGAIGTAKAGPLLGGGQAREAKNKQQREQRFHRSIPLVTGTRKRVYGLVQRLGMVRWECIDVKGRGVGSGFV